MTLAEGDIDATGAAREWEEEFGVVSEGCSLVFTNSKMRFCAVDMVNEID
ncbi:hypothetical protein M501DRAFT_930352 [Patellaria atrata CBS 101060]|uniref:Uncharacterized protein n=1 Tax=Patellaria atrata CBS 101060 TaxID=1346257 RepID=A0A9P4SFA6_9PEZI|nr:hypothetical protein M501DRAFT_930352 [Patellaria atrata CBS 101060]